MATLDLKPLSQETIEEMGFGPSDLWIVRLGQDEFGPFETKSLKHYASEHDGLFSRIQAAHPGSEEWHPFFDYPEFKRVESNFKTNQRYWILETGQKSHPLFHKDIEKKLELGTLSMTDQISLDDGHTWQKIYLLESFDQIFHSPDELPDSPLAPNMDHATSSIEPRLEQTNNAQEELISMTFLSQQKMKTAQLEEGLPVHKASANTVMSWVLSAGVAALIVGVLVSYNWLTATKGPEPVAATEAEAPAEEVVQAPEVIMPKFDPAPAAPAPEASSPSRRPASVRQMPRKQRYRDSRNSESSYPTQIETHQSEDPIANDDSLDENLPQEHSLADDPGAEAILNGRRKPSNVSDDMPEELKEEPADVPEEKFQETDAEPAIAE